MLAIVLDLLLLVRLVDYAFRRSVCSDDDAALLLLRDHHGGSLRVDIDTSGARTPAKRMPAPVGSSEGDAKNVLRLSSEEIAILCWERGLLRSGWGLRGNTSGSGTEQDEQDKFAVSAAMLNR